MAVTQEGPPPLICWIDRHIFTYVCCLNLRIVQESSEYFPALGDKRRNEVFPRIDWYSTFLSLSPSCPFFMFPMEGNGKIQWLLVLDLRKMKAQVVNFGLVILLPESESIGRANTTTCMKGWGQPCGANTVQAKKLPTI